MTSNCTVCRLALPPTEFYVLATGARASKCKACQKRAVADWREQNRARHNENARRWREANKDKIRQTNREQYKKRRPERLAASKQWAADHPEQCRAAEKRWRQKPESKALMRLKSKRWRQTHPQNASAAEHRWREAHPELVQSFARHRRARKANAPVNDFTAEQWIALQHAFDHRCAYCDRRRRGRLTQDHITPLSQGGAHTAANIVPACASCNSKKHTGPPLRPVQPVLL